MGYRNDSLQYLKYIVYSEYILDWVQVRMLKYVLEGVLSICHIELILDTRLACVFSAWNIGMN